MKSICIKKIYLTLWSLLLITTVPLSAFGLEGEVWIGQPDTFPIIIDQPGNYVFTGDLIVSSPATDLSAKVTPAGKQHKKQANKKNPKVIIHGIKIKADDVILDLNGYQLIGPGKKNGQGGSGIYASHRNNIAVINGTILGFKYGINFSGTNHKINNIKAIKNSKHGLTVRSSIITDCQANKNGAHGILAKSSTLTNCCTNNNGSHGIDAESSTIITCTANFNQSHGIYAGGSRIEGCNLRKNEGYGLYLDHDSCTAVKNKANDNSLGNFYSDGLHYFPTGGDNANCKF